MKLRLIITQAIILCCIMAGTADATIMPVIFEGWNVRESSDFILFSIIILLALGLGGLQTTTRLTVEARESGCSRRSILIQILSSFLAVSLVILGFIFFVKLDQLKGTAGVFLTFGGSAGISGTACGLLLFGNYLYENPEKLK